MPNPLSSTKNIIVQTTEIEDVSQDKVVAKTRWMKFVDWFRPDQLPVRLKYLGTFALFYDAVIAIFGASDVVTKFLAKKIPLIICNTVNITPAFLPFIPNFLQIFIEMDPAEIEGDHDRLAENVFTQLTSLKEAIDNLPSYFKTNVVIEFQQHHQNIQQLLEERARAKEKSKVGLYDDLVNAIFLVARAVVSILSIVKACKSENEATGKKLDEISKWITVASNAAYLAYFVAHYFPRYGCKKRKSIPKHLPTIGVSITTSANAQRGVCTRANTFFYHASVTAENTHALEIPLLNI